jgi:hypothetical protein
MKLNKSTANYSTWYNLTNKTVTLDGEKLPPIGTGAALTEIIEDGTSINGIKVNVVTDYQLSANGLPFPAYVHGVKYIVTMHIVDHCNRQDLFAAITDDHGNVTELRTTKAATEVLTRQTERAEKRGDDNKQPLKKTQWLSDRDGF